MKNTLFYSILLILAASCTTAKYKQMVEKLPLTSVAPLHFKEEMKMEVSEFRPIVKVKINGLFYNFMIDTSNDCCILDSTLVSSLGLAFIAKVKNQNFNTKFVELNTLNIQNIEFSKIICSVFDFREYNQTYPCLPIQGVIGVNLLKKGVWQFDYFDEKLTFANHRDSLTFPKNSKTIGFVTYSQNGVDVPIVPVRVNQNYICDAFFNTVSNQGLTFPSGLLQNVLDTTKYLTWTGIEHCRDEILSDSYKSYSLPKLNIGDVFDIQDAFVFSDKESIVSIGGYFLKDYISTFDWNKKQITFSPNKQIDNATFGFCLDFKNNKTYVDCLIKNTPADKAGIRLNDHIVKINDQDVSNISLEDFCNIENSYSQDSVKVSVKRNNEILDFILPKTNFKDLLK